MLTVSKHEITNMNNLTCITVMILLSGCASPAHYTKAPESKLVHSNVYSCTGTHVRRRCREVPLGLPGAGVTVKSPASGRVSR